VDPSRRALIGFNPQQNEWRLKHPQVCVRSQLVFVVNRIDALWSNRVAIRCAHLLWCALLATASSDADEMDDSGGE
jgi:hypothetical protein